ncbi:MULTISPECIES: hypothetical protein [unclassified Streptomyces]|uniref:hypothetical protein n=1 Tax=unclassified Streptomyces TaxID=2593676 RepID=UPI002DD9C39E|nr:hypothetical protein [Streptomyces sp. NBC_01237]WRZ72576.1 hypothetical protein OG251_13560 [Streptomyces sp. NBC_01237]
MRPARFQDFVLDLVKNTPGVTRVQTAAEAGESRFPFGLVIVAAAGESRWQIIGQLAAGEKHEHADVPVAYDALPAWGEPQAGDNAEAWLAAVIGRSESREIASITRWSTREDERPDNLGMTVEFNNGAKAFVRKV